MKKIMWLGLIPVFLMILGCEERRGRNYNTKQADSDLSAFVNEAAENSLTIAEASNLAKSHSANPDIKKFADTLFNHHTSLNEGLQNIASDTQVSYTDTISLNNQREVAVLSETDAKAFDTTYVNMMLKYHEQAVKLFTKAVNSKQPAIQSFAQKNVNAITAHLNTVRNMHASLK
ncbi:hypothetical protein DJ568_04780 [Mucilaginibacter hurinus]|uniref:DUF4142 domain-containing protein n=1 Tax=Mucilaginibacter hurinus TaxID=2201324 RepID=A0A367GTA1_9SPHI|nr:DUF4142 domain-containing protein [Mucilaginibacter hurinus]RCH56066.1 hypothetical protein DJ568_04780 [Mucilaginibacter hurinus]